MNVSAVNEADEENLECSPIHRQIMVNAMQEEVQGQEHRMVGKHFVDVE